MENPGNTTAQHIILRPFEPADQAAARGLILAGLAEHWGTLDPTLNPDLRDIAATYGEAVFFVAVAGSTLVGTGVLIHEAPGVARIVRMSVAASWRRRGIARTILAALCAEARAAGYRQIVLETTATWAGAIAFYQRNGFTITGTHDGDTHFVLDLQAPLPPAT
jgi:putative acetyltransferase